MAKLSSDAAAMLVEREFGYACCDARTNPPLVRKWRRAVDRTWDRALGMEPCGKVGPVTRRAAALVRIVRGRPEVVS